MKYNYVATLINPNISPPTPTTPQIANANDDPNMLANIEGREDNQKETPTPKDHRQWKKLVLTTEKKDNGNSKTWQNINVEKEQA